ncbi:MAG TPA: aspartate carbamoyltransferase catalytic subunit [Terriglobales bacterium]|jgi:aspartate carbamoyltransferase catalytic subunit|nr:aspartate carbamoyltransferase catalytic subunit [Terriglobales bacterium]
MNQRSLLGIEELDVKQIDAILRLARKFQHSRPRPIFKEKRIALLFFEASTRTRISFEFAAKVLGATTTLVSASASSVEKGESLIDTGLTLRALGVDVIIIRHPSSGAPHLLARHVDVPVINAGDGLHEHPSQALLDAYTILQHKKKLKGLRVAILGDIFHSRVARSEVHLLSKFGAHVSLCGPPELAPEIASQLAPGVTVTRTAEEALHQADVVVVLRIQKERLGGKRLSFEDYIARYQLTPERMAMARKDAILMHPGPVIRGVEITGNLPDYPQSVILNQVHNGVPVRMAILARALGIR